MARRNFEVGGALFSHVLDYACTANPDMFLKGDEVDAAVKKELIKVFSDEDAVNNCLRCLKAT